jgi:hypothetical protein
LLRNAACTELRKAPAGAFFLGGTSAAAAQFTLHLTTNGGNFSGKLMLLRKRIANAAILSFSDADAFRSIRSVCA